MTAPKPYSFLPILRDSDDDEDTLVARTMFANRARYITTSNSSTLLTETSATTTSNNNTSQLPDAANAGNRTASTAPSRSIDADVKTWCKCGCCKVMPTQLELKCCCDESFDLTNMQDDDFKPGVDCVSTAAVLLNGVLSEVNLQLQWFSSTQYRGATGDDLKFTNMDHASYRFHAYRSYINFMHGYLGRGNRRVIPACLVAYIRAHWPDPDDQYVGYKPVEDADEEEIPTHFVFPDELDGLLED